MILFMTVSLFAFQIWQKFFSLIFPSTAKMCTFPLILDSDVQRDETNKGKNLESV